MSDTKKSQPYRKRKNHKTFVGYVYREYRFKAKKKNIAFELSRPEFELLIMSKCYLCESPPRNKYRSKRHEGMLFYNGVDRVDNSQGYTLENAKPCCHKCNRMKSDFKPNEFIKHIKAIFKKITNKDK